MIVVHVPPDKKSVLAELFQAKCGIEVREAEDKEPISGGTVYFAPPDYHLLVETDKSLSLSNDEPVLYSRPSIDVLFESAADAYGPSLIAHRADRRQPGWGERPEGGRRSRRDGDRTKPGGSVCFGNARGGDRRMSGRPGFVAQRDRGLSTRR